MNRLVIAGAVYFDGENILIPHYTGEFHTVDCDLYSPKKEILSSYDRKYFNSVKDDYIEHNGVKYYNAEYSCFCPDDEWELLSDISNLRFERY